MGHSSLFGSDSEDDGDSDCRTALVTSSGEPKDPCIPGLFHFPQLLPADLHDQLALALSTSTYFTPPANQSMLFARAGLPLPPILAPLNVLPDLLHDLLPATLHQTLFSSSQPRQAILNLYRPGEGITPHVDLARFEDGIVGISLLGSALMTFSASKHEDRQLLLRPRDVYVMSGEARYKWMHGIAHSVEDRYLGPDGVEERLIRRLRISITLRRMVDGSDIVGGEGVEDSVSFTREGTM